MKKKKLTIILLPLLIISLYIIWYKESGRAFRNSLERYYVPACSAKNASLNTVLLHFKKELAEQGVNVETRIENSPDYEYIKNVRGIAGNGYLFLYAIKQTFNVTYTCTKHGVITFSYNNKVPSSLDACWRSN